MATIGRKCTVEKCCLPHSLITQHHDLEFEVIIVVLHFIILYSSLTYRIGTCY